MRKLGGGWDELLKSLFDDERYIKIRNFLKDEYTNYTVYPDMYDLYNCFRFTPIDKVKAVILGQDPYHEPKQAHGLCFSVQDGVAIPPSLVNIYKELKSDLGIEPASSGNLTKWANEGVLLLNATLSVREHQANSHSKCGWTWFTDEVIKLVDGLPQPIVFILWGGNARAKKSLIKGKNHFVIESAHPSPLSAYNGFFGSKPFSKTNEFLEKNGIEPIKWSLLNK